MSNSTEKIKQTFRLGGDPVINRLGYGAMQLTGFGVFGDVKDRNSAKEVLQEAVGRGVNFIDTADAYGPHTNEELIAEALYPYPEDLVIATKGGFERPGPNKWVANGDPAFIRKNIEGSLKRLKLDCIPLWQLHRIDANIPLEETLAPVVEAVMEGKIRYVGLSEVTVEQVDAAQKIVPIVSVQNLYNLGVRKWDGMVDFTATNGLAFIPWFPLASGPDALAGKIADIAAKHHATTAQIALAWLLRRSPNILLIPGTSSTAHLKENLKAIDIELSDEEFAELSK